MPASGAQRAIAPEGASHHNNRSFIAIGTVIVAVLAAVGAAAWRHERAKAATSATAAKPAATLVSKGNTLYGPTESITLGNFACRAWTVAEVVKGAPKGSEDCALTIRVRNDSNATDDGYLEDWQWQLFAGNAHYDGSAGEIASMAPGKIAPGLVTFTMPTHASPSRIEITELARLAYEGHYYELSLNT